MMNEKKLSQMILKLHDRAEAAKYDGDSSPPYQEVEMLNSTMRNRWCIRCWRTFTQSAHWQMN